VSHDLPGPELAGLVLPGAYGIAYHESYFTKSIPWGAGVLKPSASIADGTAVLVDMPTGALTVVVSLGADPIVGAEYATGYLYGMSAEGTLLTLSSVGFTEPKTVKSVMLPGTYALYYQANWFALTEWESGPLAPLTPLGCVTIMPTSP
jgi:hypothetical protein